LNCLHVVMVPYLGLLVGEDVVTLGGRGGLSRTGGLVY